MTTFVVITVEQGGNNGFDAVEVDVFEAQDKGAVERHLWKRHKGEVVDGDDSLDVVDTWEKMDEYLRENTGLRVSIHEVEKRVVL